VISEDSEHASLSLVNQSEHPLLDVTVEFDILGSQEFSDEDLRSLADQHTGPFTFKREIPNFQEYQNVDLIEELRTAVPDIDFYRFAMYHTVEREDTDLVARDASDDDELGPRVPLPQGFVEFYERVFADGVALPGLYLLGQVTSKASSGEIMIADFAAIVSLYGEGFGSGPIAYDLMQRINLPIDGKPHKRHAKIDITLSQDKETFRGLYPLVATRSSFHDVQVSVIAANGSVLFQSPWIDTQIYVSPPDRKALEEFGYDAV
jgi:hypothetical protein